MDLTFQVPNIVFYSIGLTSITTHIHNCVLFSLWLHFFIVSGAISPLFSSSSILGTYQPGEFIFQYPIFLPFHTVHLPSNQMQICSLQQVLIQMSYIHMKSENQTQIHTHREENVGRYREYSAIYKPRRGARNRGSLCIHTLHKIQLR